MGALAMAGCAHSPSEPKVERPSISLPNEETSGSSEVTLPQSGSSARIQLPKNPKRRRDQGDRVEIGNKPVMRKPSPDPVMEPKPKLTTVPREAGEPDGDRKTFGTSTSPEVRPKPSLRPSPKPGVELPQALREVETKYSQAQTLIAEFTQVNETAATGARKESKGILYARRPNQIRWETRSPDANLLVSDGKKFWFYTPPFDESEHGQVIEKSASQVQTKLANALLSGSFSSTPMKIEEKSPTQFVLIPKQGTAGTVRRAEIRINAEKREIQTVTLEHEGGNRSEIQLTAIELGKPINAQLFHFTPPPGTDRVDP